MPSLRVVMVLVGIGVMPGLTMRYAPILGFLLTPLLVASQTAAFIEGGLKMGIGVALLVTLVLVAFFGFSEVTLSTAVLILFAAIMAFGLKKWGMGLVLVGFAVAAVTAIVFFGVWALAFWVGQQDPLTFLAESMLQAQPAEGTPFTGEGLRAFVRWTALLFPSLMFCVLSWDGFAALALLGHYKTLTPPQEGLLGIRFPDVWVWFFLGGGFALFLFKDELIRAVAGNIFLISSCVFFFRGLCLILGALNRLELPFMLNATVGLMHAIVFPMTVMSILVGLSDIWLDIRGRVASLRFDKPNS